VYAPTTIDGRAPIVVLQHGRHVPCASEEALSGDWPCPAEIPEVPSYQGYRGLGTLLASHGMVVVSVGANGINANDGVLADGGASARGQLILEHLRRWQTWTSTGVGSPFGDRFVDKVDFDRVGLMGHSRGGEGVAFAVALNQRIGAPFGIDAVVLLAPVDFARRIVSGVHSQVVLPACDGDVFDLQGAAYYDDGRYESPGDPTSRTAILLDGANHNFFNTVWTSGPGSFDDADFSFFDGASAASAVARTVGPDPDLSNCRASAPNRLTAGEQLAAGEALMAGHLRRHLGPEPSLARFVTGTAPFPPSVGPARWTTAHHDPDRYDVERWVDAATIRDTPDGQLVQRSGFSSALVCNPSLSPGFLGGPATVSLVRAACRATDPPLLVTNDTGVLDASWVRSGAVLRQPLERAGVDLRAYDGLRFRVAVGEDARNSALARQDLTVVLEDATGARAAVVASEGTNALEPLNPGFVRHAFLAGVRLPLARFAGIDLGAIRAVELRFDRTPAGRLQLADLAFTQEDLGDVVGPSEGPPPQPQPPGPCRGTEAARWACAVAQVAWGRSPSPSEVARISQGYPSPAARRAGVQWAMTRIAAGRLHHLHLAQTYTQSETDLEVIDAILSAAGRATWERATVELAGGLVYSTPPVSSTPKIIDSLYRTLAGRPADPAGLAFWTPRVDREGAQQLAQALVFASAHRRRVVDERYRAILGRAPDPAGLAYWTERLRTAGGQQSLVIALLATESFRASVTR
jgi:hypothetical protein